MISGRQRHDAATMLVLLGILALLPLGMSGSRYLMSVLMNCEGVAVIATGVWVTFMIGRTNICQAGFALVGAYATAILTLRHGLGYWLVLPLSVSCGAACGAVIGSAVLKLKGIYFAMLTICLAEAIRLAFLNGGDFTQGARGMTGIPQPFAADDVLAPYYLGLCLLAVALLVAYRVQYTRLGGIFRAMRLNEDLAESFGIDVWRYRVLAFVIACALAAAGGSYFAVVTQSVYPQSFTVEHSIYYLLYCFLGGLEFASGASVGAFVLNILFEFLQAFQRYQSLLYGVLMIVVMLVLPNGLLALLEQLGSRAAPGAGAGPAAAGEQSGDRDG